MKPAVFTRENPCTKVDIANCFKTSGAKVPVVHAQAVIGVNTPKYLLREGYVVAVSAGGVDYYQLTQHGSAWLEKGLASHLKRHPTDGKRLTGPYFGAAAGKSPVLRRRR